MCARFGSGECDMPQHRQLAEEVPALQLAELVAVLRDTDTVAASFVHVTANHVHADARVTLFYQHVRRVHQIRQIKVVKSIVIIVNSDVAFENMMLYLELQTQ